jgi:glucoamylase
MSAAPGGTGLRPTWCSSAKEMVGCSLGSSRLWFTIGGGIINEVYYPRVDLPQIRDLGFIVADGGAFWVEVKRLWQHVVQLAAPGAPAVHIVHRHERFELALRVAPCEHRDVLLIEVSLSGDATLKPYALLGPHVGGTGANNRAEVVIHRGRKLLWAEQGPYGLALAAVTAEQRDAFARASAGVVGTSDGSQDIRELSTTPSSLGLQLEIDTQRLHAGQHVDFTYRKGAPWIGRDFRVLIVPRGRAPA